MDRLEPIHRALAEALQRNRPDDAFAVAVTVAEIYQDLVPYRSVRTQLGFEMNADYEHTLLRLLAGEGSLARLEPPEARDELLAELETANPNVGLFRKFAACDVWIARPSEQAVAVASDERAHGANGDMDTWDTRASLWIDPPHVQPEPEAEPQSEPESQSEPEAQSEPEPQIEETFELLLDDAIEPEPPAVVAAPVPEPIGESVSAVMPADAPPSKSEKPGLSTVTTPVAERAQASLASCAFCDSTLPRGRTVRFCPFCGADQSMLPCGSCGEPMEGD